MKLHVIFLKNVRFYLGKILVRKYKKEYTLWEKKANRLVISNYKYYYFISLKRTARDIFGKWEVLVRKNRKVKILVRKYKKE